MELEADRPPNKQTGTRWWGSITFFGALWWLFLIAIFGMLIAVLVQQSNQAASLSLTWARMSSIETHGLGGRGAGGRTISVASQLAQNRPIVTRFCGTHAYFSPEGRSNDTMQRLDALIDQFTQGAAALYYYDLLDVALDIELGADMSGALSVATKALFKMSQDVKYMAFVFNITTSYPYFSTAKLQEVEFDPYERSFRPVRTIVLCSNTHLVSTRRCDRRTEDNTYAVHGRSWRPVLAQTPTKPAPSAPSGGAHAKTPAPRPRTGTNAADSEEELYDLIESGGSDASPSHIDSQKESIQGVRLYNVVFYRQPGLDRLYTAHGMGNSAAGATPREEKALTLELNRC